MSDWVGLVIAGAVLAAGGWIAGAIRSFHPKAAQIAAHIEEIRSHSWEIQHYLKKIEFWTQATSENTQK